MKYLEFIERVRSYLVVYESILARYFVGDIDKEKADKMIDLPRKEIADLITYYKDNKASELDIGDLCPQCNLVKEKTEGGPKFAVYPARVGQLLHHTSDVWQGHEWYECPICHCQRGMTKIEHWE